MHRHFWIDAAALASVGLLAQVHTSWSPLLCMGVAAAWACWNYWEGLKK